MSISLACQQLHAFASPLKASILQKFFKTGPGEYGEGDIFIGVKVPEIRHVAKTFPTLPLKDLIKLLKRPIHEERLLALIIMTYQFKKSTPAIRKDIFDAYLKNTAHINNWDLVDLSAPNIVGEWLLKENRSILDKMARSPLLWDRRIAIVSTLNFIRQNQLKDTLRISKILLYDQEDLMHKATGWMLREAGKRNAALLKAFLRQNIKVMPRTMLRYAIEKFPEQERQHYLHK